ncbi:MAG: hypothetical protein RL596_209 [Bacteroidota bacterium]
MKKYLILLITIACCLQVAARHIAGGELYYTFLNSTPDGNSKNYRVALRLFRDCSSTGPLLTNESVTVGIYENGLILRNLPLSLEGPINTLRLNTTSFPCLTGNINVCYEVAIFSNIVTLPNNAAGYTLSRLGCCRVDFITNLGQSTSIGSNYSTKIPGSLLLPNGSNSSPQFNVKDTALVCATKKFSLDFGAEDADNDVLTYSFCDAFAGGSTNLALPPNILSQQPVPYSAPYAGSSPLGAFVTIDPNTGIISGTAPPEGKYVVSVCITEWRNNVPFSEHRKDFILEVKSCDLIEANLPEKIIQCKDYTVLFENGSAASGITSYVWNFGDSLVNIHPQSGSVLHTYKNPGTYLASLTVTGPRGCIGNDTARVLVYPGFKPGFTVQGSCILNPYQFKDTTSSVLGIVNFWKWNFGDETTLADTSITKNAAYKYGTSSTKRVLLISGDTKGCIDSSFFNLPVSDKPFIQLPFRDTLICSIDTLAIPVTQTTGIFSWQPNNRILFPNTNRPLVFPQDTANYIVTVNDNGCVNTDTVTINVLPFIRVDAGMDTIICRTDSVQLKAVSEALQFQWTSNRGDIISSVKTPFVKPLTNTTYYVVANLGKCEHRDSVHIRSIPYPVANIGNDTAICANTKIVLRANIVGSSFMWQPTNAMINANTLNPTIAPSRNTAYTLTVRDTIGCNKPSIDSIHITVVPVVAVNAGNDTAVSIGQPLQLLATGADNYFWSPGIGLNDRTIANPIATYGEGIDSVLYRVVGTNGGACLGEDQIMVRIFKKGPNIFVPSGFTPNGDGKNDLLRPIPIGISTINYFRVFNRWGELMYQTSNIGEGWNGIFNGTPMPGGAYVYVTEGKDYTGKIIFRKGTSVLIR